MNGNFNEAIEFAKKFESAKKGINPDCKNCGGTGYDSHPNHMTTYPICLDCEAWSKNFLAGGWEPNNPFSKTVCAKCGGTGEYTPSKTFPDQKVKCECQN